MLQRQRKPRALVLEGETVEIRVRESRRARRARIVVSPNGGVEVVVPLRVSYAEIDRILDEARDWIVRKRGRLIEPSSLGLDRAGVVWIALEPVPVQVVQHQAAGRAALENDRLVVTSPSAAETGAAIDRWYRRESRRRVTASVEREAARLGVRHTSIAIRDQRTRWGSCSTRGTLSFNWRLVIAPEEVLDYLVVHELCHLRELNHSKDFWRLVEQAMPDWRQQRRWLNEHGPELQAYVPLW